MLANVGLLRRSFQSLRPEGDTTLPVAAGRETELNNDHCDVTMSMSAIHRALHRPTLASVVLESEITQVDDDTESGFRVATATPEVLDTACRLARLLDHPQDITVLAPLIERELLYRLLTGPWSITLREIARADSRISQVSRAAIWLRQNYARDYRADMLAKVAAMSVSSLNRHFRAVTAMSPLEYQKRIRLQEARQLLLTRNRDVTGVGYTVGYRSVSQFNREYRRLFGEPPGSDAEQLRRKHFRTRSLAASGSTTIPGQ